MNNENDQIIALLVERVKKQNLEPGQEYNVGNLFGLFHNVKTLHVAIDVLLSINDAFGEEGYTAFQSGEWMDELWVRRNAE